MLKIVADNKIPFLKGALEPYASVQYLPGAEINNDVLKDADALITRTRTKCNQETLGGSTVKIITSATIGFDHIDTRWCDHNGIRWTNAPGCNSGSVKQYVAAVLALLAKEKGCQLKGKSIAVVGVGNVGSKVSAMAKALGMTVYEVDPPRARVEKNKEFYTLNKIIGKADIITFHTPLTKEGEDKTYHLCDAFLLSKMKKDAIVINSSRGEVVDGNALKLVLQNNQIGDAVLDVWEKEPAIDAELLDKVWIGTPHIAGYSQDGKAKGTQMSVQAISRFFSLGIDDWQAKGMPQPDQSIFTINCKGLSDEAIIAKAILHTYPLKRDDADLRNEISGFEYLRGAYPVRREFQAYTLELTNGNTAIQDTLQKLGFSKVEIK
ncbi:4-phosphoerythronate dehydrogenase PdxB [Carboxylicivirga sp. A043]|uniref:4-phosphoerythronate dehydrogenase PdxB n=1 Tax=Carboxylicivirga litoralis TaxID=2816963 RepID=UPI0021CB9670|nr:4-phosphoerythronate dehydrogenase PdxB [Carboxylicivirga sp. A043]MCU4154775.1 4-phosphoerythronate dehydrogenase PdxB [Carboxylicivirga sp. A043]